MATNKLIWLKYTDNFNTLDKDAKEFINNMMDIFINNDIQDMGNYCYYDTEDFNVIAISSDEGDVFEIKVNNDKLDMSRYNSINHAFTADYCLELINKCIKYKTFDLTQID